MKVIFLNIALLAAYFSYMADSVWSPSEPAQQINSNSKFISQSKSHELPKEVKSDFVELDGYKSDMLKTVTQIQKLVTDHTSLDKLAQNLKTLNFESNNETTLDNRIETPTVSPKKSELLLQLDQMIEKSRVEAKNNNNNKL